MKAKRFLFVIIPLVVVCLIAELIPFASASVILRDGFESGNFDSWTDTYGSPELVSDVKHSGSYGAFINASGIHSCYYGAYKSAGWGNHLFARAYYKFSPILGNYGIHFVTYISNWGYNGSDQMIAVAELEHLTGSTYMWAVRVYGASQVSGYSSAFVLNTTHWYSLELETYVDSVAGYANLYIDDVLVASVTGITNNIFGEPNHVGFGQLGDLRDGEAVWWDDCVIADSYIGLEAPTPTGLSVSVSPASVTLNDGQSQVFAASVSGGSGVSYQWYVDGAEQTGETFDTFTYTASLGDSAVSVTVTDAASDTASDSATVSVNSPTPTPTATPTSGPTTSPDSTPTPSPTTSPTQAPNPEPEPQTNDLLLEYLTVAAGIFIALVATAAFLLLKKKK